ncbi:DUF6953 family protein [Alcaligenes phenolicus]|uniref:DUF6953 family protein n=1 Tax=Alcaligenes phenolicus TaxID=232846 RepID=UPI00352CB98A
MAIGPVDVAKWMFGELQRERYLYQETVVYDIQSNFGEDFIYFNDSGNPAISKKVLYAFRKLTGDLVVWDKGERMWRFREAHDEPGRQQL